MAITFCIPMQVVNMIKTAWNAIDNIDRCVEIIQYGNTNPAPMMGFTDVISKE